MNARRIVVAGLIASVVMGMVEMVFEALAGGGFWAPVTYIGATVLRGLQSLQPPVGFHFGAVVLGLMGHMMNSVILTVIFAVSLARRLSSRGALIVSGAVYGMVVFVVMWSLVVPALDPVMLQLNAAVFALAHLMWGGTLGLFLRAPEAAAVPRVSAA